MKKILTSSAYYVPAVIIFAGVTALYWMKYDGTDPQGTSSDCLIYWATYAVVTLFLQFVIYVNAKRQLQREQDR